MKTIKFEEFSELNMNSLSEYNVTAIAKTAELARKVSVFIPTEVFVIMNEDEGELTSFENAEVRIIHPSLHFRISYDDYRKKYGIYCKSIHDLKNCDYHTVGWMKEKLTEPVKIGVLSAKKIQAWIKYYEDLYALLLEKDTERGNEKTKFLESLRDQPVRWINDGQRGLIQKNGLEFEFNIMETGISTKISLHYSSGNDLEAFLKLADNKF